MVTKGGRAGRDPRPQCSCSFSLLRLCPLIGGTADANPVNKVIEILTKLEAKIKAEGVDACKWQAASSMHSV